MSAATDLLKRAWPECEGFMRYKPTREVVGILDNWPAPPDMVWIRSKDGRKWMTKTSNLEELKP